MPYCVNQFAVTGDKPAAVPTDLALLLQADESIWREARESVLLYRE